MEIAAQEIVEFYVLFKKIQTMVKSSNKRYAMAAVLSIYFGIKTSLPEYK